MEEKHGEYLGENPAFREGFLDCACMQQVHICVSGSEIKEQVRR